MTIIREIFITEAREYLQALFGHPDLDGQVQVALWTLDGKKTTCYPTADLSRAAEAVAGVPNVYAHVALTRDPLPAHQRITAATAAGIVGLWADIDVISDAHSKKGLPTHDQALSLLNQCPLEPTLVVYSGHGMQPYWLLTDPWLFADDADRQEAQRLAKAWHDLFCQGLKLDNVADLARVLRIPGTVNVKPNLLPVYTRLMRHGKQRYTLDQFRSLLPAPTSAPTPALAPAASVVVPAPAGMSRYALSALAGECDKVRAAQDGTRNNTLNNSALALGQLVGAGALTATTVESELLAAATAAGLPEREARATIKSGLLAGIKVPRQLPESKTICRQVSGADADVCPKISVKTKQTSARRRIIIPWHHFPVNALPDPVQSFILAGAEAMRADTAYFVLPMLSALAGAIGQSRVLKIKRTWREPAIIWTCGVGRSGTTKSPPMDLVLEPLQTIQNAWFQNHETKRREHEEALQQYEAEFQQWKRSRDRGEPPTKPAEPICKRIVTSESTTEALAPILKENPRGLLLARDELSGWFGSFDRYSQGSADAARWLELFHGRSLTIDRKTGVKVIHVPRAAVSVCGTIQPGVLERCLCGENFENGLGARLLLAAPPPIPKVWSDDEVPQAMMNDLADLFGRLLALAPEIQENGMIRPVDLEMSPEARALWIQRYNAFGQRQAAAQSDHEAAALSKLEAYCARFALVLHLVQHPDGSGLVNVETMQNAILLTDWFACETERLYTGFGETDAERESRELASWVRMQQEPVTPRYLARHLRRYPTVEDAEAALRALTDAGYGTYEYAPPPATGGQQSKVFKLHPSADVRPDFEPETGQTSASAGSVLLQNETREVVLI